MSIRSRLVSATDGERSLDRCILEVAGDFAGILVRERRGYVFVSATRRFRALNRVRFESIRKACCRLDAFARRIAKRG